MSSSDIIKEFKHALGDLTINSKPIINHLTDYAKQNVHCAPLLTDAILEYFAKSDYKVPSLFLIDSVAKNVGGEYVPIIEQKLINILPAIYKSIQGEEKSRKTFDRTIATWKAVFSASFLTELDKRIKEMEAKEVHGKERKISARIASVKRKQVENSGRLAPYTLPPNKQLDSKILRLLDGLSQNVQVPAREYDESKVIEIMRELEISVDTNLFEALDARARLVDKRPLVNLVDNILQKSIVSEGDVFHKPSTITSSAPPSSRQQPSTIATEQPPNKIPKISPRLEQTLKGLDLSKILPIIKKPSVNTKPAFRFPLETNILTKYSPVTYRALYEDLSNQCSTCAARFPNTEKGKSRLNEHLDAHFRRNIRLKDKAKRVFARVWMPKETDWIENRQDSVQETPAALFASSQSKDGVIKATKVPASAKNHPKIVAPKNETIKCAKCQEAIDVEWDDDMDDWCYRDATKNASTKKIVHISCLLDD